MERVRCKTCGLFASARRRAAGVDMRGRVGCPVLLCTPKMGDLDLMC